MKKMLMSAVVGVCLLATTVPPIYAGATCAAEWRQGTLVWVFNESEFYHLLREPGTGVNRFTCISEPWECEMYRCEVNAGSPFGCKDNQAPVGHCVNVLLAQCEDFDPKAEPGFQFILRSTYIYEIQLISTGPCPAP